MALGVKYRMEWSDFMGGSEAYKLDIEIEGGPDSVGIISLGHTENAFILNQNETAVIQGSEAIISFHVDNDTDRTNYDADFYDSVYKDAKVKFYIDGTLKWVGWVKPENTTRDFSGPVALYQLSVTDGLNDLKNVDYTGFETTGRQSLLQVIKNALNFNGIDDLDFFIQCNIYEDVHMLSTEDPFEETQGNNTVFYKTEDGENKPDKCYTVLEKAVKSLYCTLAMVDGYWQITNGQEYNTEKTVFDYDSLTSPSGQVNVPYDRRVDISAYHRPEGSKFELSKRPPIKKLKTTFRNKNIGGNEIATNSDFETGGAPPTGWTNSGWDQFTTVTEGDGNKVGNVVENTTNSDVKYIQASTFSLTGVDTSNDLLEVQYKVKLKAITLSSGTEFPKVYPALLHPGGTEEQAFAQYITEIDGDFTIITRYFALPEDGTYTLRLYVEPRDPTSVLNYYFDDVIVTHGAVSNTSTDSLYVGTSAITAYKEQEEVLHLLEGLETTDIGALTIGASDLTSSWTRYGVTAESLSLINLYTQQYLNDRQANHDLLKVELLDQDEELHYNSIIQLGEKTYKWLEMSKNYKSKLVSGTLAEVDNSSDVGFTLSAQSLTSVDGVSSEPSTVPNDTFFPTLQIVTGYSAAIDGFVSTTHSIMIGEAEAPDSLLHIKDNTNNVVLHLESANVASAVVLALENDANRWDVMVDIDESFRISDITGGNLDPFIIEKATPSNTLFLDAAGRVGMHMNNPSYPLDVTGIIRTSTSVYANNVTVAGTGYTSGEWKTAWDKNVIDARLDGTRLWLDTRDTVDVDTGIDIINAISANQYEIPFVNAGGTGFDFSATFVNTATGVGIGEASPSVLLHLKGAGDELLRLEDISAIGDPFLAFYQTTTFRAYIQYTDTADTLHFVSKYGGLGFWTDSTGTEVLAMTIDSSQNVGIRTGSPQAPLEIEDGGTEHDSVLKVTADDQIVWGIIIGNDTASTTDSYGLRMFVSDDGTGNIEAESATTENLIFQRNGGNVGIGTSSPDELVHIHEPSSDEAFMKFTNTTTTEGATSGMIVGLNTAEEAIIWQYENDNLVFGTNNTTRIFIQNDGKVGIGTSNPDELFHIEGSAAEGEIAIQQVNTAVAHVDNKVRHLFRANTSTTERTAATLDVTFSDITDGTREGFYNIQVADGGAPASRLVIKGSKVGIGETSPSVLLHLTGAGDELLRLEDTSATGDPLLAFYQTTTLRAYIQFGDSGNMLHSVSKYGGLQFWTDSAGSEAIAMTITSSQDVGIGEIAPAAKLEVNQAGTGDILICSDSEVWHLLLGEDGDLHIDGDVIGYSSSTSDPRFKGDLQKFMNPLDIINNVTGYEFEWVKGRDMLGKRAYGFMADEVQRILPYAVEEEMDVLDKWGIGKGPFLTMEKDKMLPVLWEGVKVLNKEVKDHERRLEKLEKAELIDKVLKLEERLNQLAV